MTFIQNLIAKLHEDPKGLIKKMGMLASGLALIAIIILSAKVYLGKKQDDVAREKKQREEIDAQMAKRRVAVDWNEKLRQVVPNQEEILLREPGASILVPPPMNRDPIPGALKAMVLREYTRAYHVIPTPYIQGWSGTKKGFVPTRAIEFIEPPRIDPGDFGTKLKPYGPKSPNKPTSRYLSVDKNR